MIDKAGGRKFVLAVLAQLSVNALMWGSKISDQVFATVVLATVGAYLAANVTHKQIDKPEGEK